MENKQECLSDIEVILANLFSGIDVDEKVGFLNEVRSLVNHFSPFSDQPIDLIKWVKADSVEANDYNPNSVAPPEMKLLENSIIADGYTQPVVTWNRGDVSEVVDGFHRTRVAKESSEVSERIHGYLPIVEIKASEDGKGDRMASTIRHNRARGKHNVTSMSDIVIELKKRNWSDSKIAKNLGMDEDEILRLCQISGLTDLFADQEFSHSWDIGIFDEDDTNELIGNE